MTVSRQQLTALRKQAIHFQEAQPTHQQDLIYKFSDLNKTLRAKDAVKLNQSLKINSARRSQSITKNERDNFTPIQESQIYNDSQYTDLNRMKDLLEQNQQFSNTQASAPYKDELVVAIDKQSPSGNAKFQAPLEQRIQPKVVMVQS